MYGPQYKRISFVDRIDKKLSSVDRDALRVRVLPAVSCCRSNETRREGRHLQGDRDLGSAKLVSRVCDEHSAQRPGVGDCTVDSLSRTLVIRRAAALAARDEHVELLEHVSVWRGWPCDLQRELFDWL